MGLEQGGYSLQPASLVIHELSFDIQRLADGRRKERFRSYLQNLRRLTGCSCSAGSPSHAPSQHPPKNIISLFMTISSKSTSSSRVLLYGIWQHLSKRRRIQLGLLLLVMLANGLAEVFSLAVVLTFLAVLSDPQRIWQQPVLQGLAKAVGITAALL